MKYVNISLTPQEFLILRLAIANMINSTSFKYWDEIDLAALSSLIGVIVAHLKELNRST